MNSIASPTLTISLGAILKNHQLLGALSAGTVPAGVIKADAYGLGSARVLEALQQHGGARDFFVATGAEAAGICATLSPNSRLYVLNAGQQQGPEPLQQTHFVVNSLEDYRLHKAAGWPIHALHIDTGMNRFGVPPQDVPAIDASDLADGCLVMSHFVEAEVRGSSITSSQIKLYRALVQSTRDRLPNGRSIRTSLGNSAGMFVPGADSDVPRPGYALYGGNPTPWADSNPMHAVVTLEAPIVQTRRLKAGESVGYGATWRATSDCWVATLGLGYADGWHCHSAGQALVRFRDDLAVVVGRISMDSMVICTQDAEPRVGEAVQLIGATPQLCVDAVGSRAGTIGYEVLTSLGNRLKRHYV